MIRSLYRYRLKLQKRLLQSVLYYYDCGKIKMAGDEPAIEGKILIDILSVV